MRDTFNDGAVNLSLILGDTGDFYTLQDLGYTEADYEDLTQEIRNICTKIYNFRAFGAPWMFSNAKIMFNTSMTEKTWTLRKSIIYLVADEWGQVNMYVLDHIYKHPMEIFFNIAPNGVIRDFYDIKGSKEPKMFKLHGSSVLEYYYLIANNKFIDNTSSCLDVTLFSMPIKDHIQCAAYTNPEQGLLTALYNPEQGYLSCFNIYTQFAKTSYAEGITDSDTKNMAKPPLSAQSIAAIMADIYVNKNRLREYTEHDRKNLINKLGGEKTVVKENVYERDDRSE